MLRDEHLTRLLAQLEAAVEAARASSGAGKDDEAMATLDEVAIAIVGMPVAIALQLDAGSLSRMAGPTHHGTLRALLSACGELGDAHVRARALALHAALG